MERGNVMYAERHWPDARGPMPKPKIEKEDIHMWKKYEVELKMLDKFAASLPKTKEEIQAMLENRMPSKPPENFTPIAELTEEVAEKVATPAEGEEEEEELKYGWATFPRNEEGLYYEGRCIRGHLKDCANQIKDVKPEVRALKAKVANKVYVMTDIIPLLIWEDDKPLKEGEPSPTRSLRRAKEIAGTQQRFVQVMTRQGPRSTIKYVDYLEKPTLKFRLSVLEDGIITKEILTSIFEYGSIHGLGQERSQGWGRYDFTITEVK